MIADIKNQGGFSLLEMVMVIFITSCIAMVTGEILVSSLDTSLFIVDNQQMNADGRYALNYLAREFSQFDTNGNYSNSGNKITFKKTNGQNVTIETYTYQTYKNISVDNQPLLYDAADLQVRMIDAGGLETTDTTKLSLFEIELHVTDHQKMYQQVLSTRVFPKTLAYESFN